MRNLTILAFALLAASCTFRVGEDRLLHPTPGGGINMAALGQAAPAYTASDEWIVAADGNRLSAVRLRQPGATRTILYFGGNGYTIERHGAWTASVFAPLGVDLLIVDHRGYGRSQGVPTQANMEGDAIAAFDHLRGLGVAAEKIVVHGHSLGSFLAGRVAAERPTAGLVLESSATNAEDWVDANVRGLARLFVRTEIDESLRGRGNLANLARVEEPVLILVGSRDRTTPPSLSRRLYDGSPLPEGRKRLYVAEGFAHDNVLTSAGAIAAYRAFLQGL